MNSDPLRRALIFVPCLSVLIGGRVLAQDAGTMAREPRLAVGFAQTATFSRHAELVSGEVGVASALWGEVSFGLSKSLRMHLAAELPGSIELSTNHLGSAGFFASYRHRDISISTLVGFPSGAHRRVRAIGLLGGGIVFTRTVIASTRTGFFLGPPPPTFTSLKTPVFPALVGGAELEVIFSDRIQLIGKMHGRYTWRVGQNYYTNVVGRVTISPGIGLQFAL